MYKIKADYQTGNSFITENEIIILDIEWESLELAKKNLHYIEEHYNMYKELNSWQKDSDEVIKKYKNKPWFVPKSHNNCMKFEIDNGNIIQISLPWIGYFEYLNSAEIIYDFDDVDIIIRFDA